MTAVTVQDIENARVVAVRNADRQIVEAIARRDSAATDADRQKIDHVIDSLMTARRDLNGAACDAQDASPEMVAALRALGAATTNMKRVAEHSKKLAEFITLAASFVDAGVNFANVISGRAGTAGGGASG